MRYTAGILVLAALAATLAHTQTLPHFQHIIILFQENRTPDNLFGGNLTFEPGVDLQQSQLAQPWCLGACFDPNHSHPSFEAILNPPSPQAPMCNGGKSSCSNTVVACAPQGTYCNGRLITQTLNNAQETYVSPTYDGSVVAPYFDIATKYGFANYMFQTNEGPSNPAHQFIFSGTSSASGNSGQQYYLDFAAENPHDSANTGCAGDPVNHVLQIDQSGNENNNMVPPIFPCFDHPTMANLLDPNGIAWKYYANRHSPAGNSLWTAPNSIKDICDGSPGGSCGGTEWDEHVVLNSQDILDDIEPPPGVSGSGCDLPAVSWVIPLGDRSDHPGLSAGQDSKLTEFGPTWVADVINEVGTTTCTDTLANGLKVPYWQDTAIFVTWDDWGGFWDHVDPDSSAGGPGVLYNAPGHSCTQFGCGYIYGFRVPLLVVSAYTPAGYVSGACQSPGNCQNEKFPYIHDFGSILAFIENNFDLGIGSINPQYPFADNFAPDYKKAPLNVPLADFFGLTTPRQFQPIVLPSGWQGYDANYFLNYNGPIMDPDNDVIDND